MARENWNAQEAIRQRHESVDAYLLKTPLRDRKSVSLDLATGTGKSFVMYALAAIALAEGLAERAPALCPSLTIEDGLLEKFTALAGNGELSGMTKELGAAVAIPVSSAATRRFSSATSAWRTSTRFTRTPARPSGTASGGTGRGH